MKNLLQAKWLLLSNSLPLLILAFIKFGEFQIIKTDLDTESQSYWYGGGVALATLFLLNLALSLRAIRIRQELSLYTGIWLLVSHIALAYFYYWNIDLYHPWSIAPWMVDEFSMLHVGSFFMPSLIHGLLIIVSYLSPKDKGLRAWPNIIAGAIIPAAWYLFSQILLPLWQPIDDFFGIHAAIVFGILGSTLFLFFILRAIWIAIHKKERNWSRYQLLWKVPIGIVLPLLGLAVNRGFLLDRVSSTDLNVLGDFSHPIFPIIVILNGILLCLPDRANKAYRFFRFFGLAVFSSFVFYFFIVFLPFIPFSVVAIVFAGLGFLLLCPLFLFVIQVNELTVLFRQLEEDFSKQFLRVILLISILILPFAVHFNYSYQRSTLDNALDYVYNPNYSKSYQIDLSALEACLDQVKKHKGRNSLGLIGSKTPYLSNYYRWLVFDNLTLPDAKIENLEHIFFDAAIKAHPSFDSGNDEVKITDLKARSEYNPVEKYWSSFIDIELSNTDSTGWQKEYATILDLPKGCWINDYYLYVGDSIEYGILSEKKSAMWIYSQIRDTRRDPGILYYLNGNQVAFRVFPFSSSEVRKTGLQLIHKESFQLEIDGVPITLGNPGMDKGEIIENEDFAFIDRTSKAGLPLIEREGYFHFIVNQSSTTPEHWPETKRSLKALIDKHPKLGKKAKLSVVGTYVEDFEFQTAEAKAALKVDTNRAFFLDRALRKALVNNHLEKSKAFPVLVVYTGVKEQGLLRDNFLDLEMCMPELPYYFRLNDNVLKAYSLRREPNQIRDSIDIGSRNPVRHFRSKEGHSYYLEDDEESSIVLKNEYFELDSSQLKSKSWHSALAMEAEYRSHIFHPEIANENWRNLVFSSFKSHIMNPYTSFLVVETESQKAMLRKKQEEVLSGKKALSPGEETLSMSEPKWWLIALLMLPIIYWRNRKRIKSQIFS